MTRFGKMVPAEEDLPPLLSLPLTKSHLRGLTAERLKERERERKRRKSILRCQMEQGKEKRLSKLRFYLLPLLLLWEENMARSLIYIIAN